MYRKTNPNQLAFEEFNLPFGGKLRSNNRQLLLSKQIPWQDVEQEYARHFSEEEIGFELRRKRAVRIILENCVIAVFSNNSFTFL